MHESLAARRCFYGGLAVFAVVKMAWILFPVYVMGLPRLGDDSLAYLWSGINSAYGGHAGDPAVSSVKRIFREYPADGPAVEFERQRVAMRVVGSDASPFYGGLGLALEAGVNPKLAFAAIEVLALGVLTAGIVGLLTALFTGPAAGLALMPLAVTFFPGQGIHFLVPSVLALGFGLLLCRMAAVSHERAGLAAVLAFAAQSVHPIGLVYCIAAICFVLALAFFERRSSLTVAMFIGGVLLGIVLARLLTKIPGADPEISTHLGALDLTTAPRNLIAALSAFGTTLREMPVPLAVAWGIVAITVLVHLPDLARQRHRGLILLALFASTVLAGACYDLPGYPGDLSVRLAVPFGIIAAGVGAYVLLQASPAGTGRGNVLLGLALLVVALSLPLTTSRFFQNINGRFPVYDSAALVRQIAALPPASNILYADTDLGLMMALVSGGARHGAIAFQALPSNVGPGDLPPSLKPDFLAATLPQSLNSLAQIRSTSIEPRYWGFGFKDFREVVATVPVTTANLFLKVSPLVRRSGLKAFKRMPFGNCDIAIHDFADANGASWVSLDFTSCGEPGGLIVLTANASDVRILGLSLDEPTPGLNWQWGSAVTITGLPRFKGRSVSVDLSWNGLLSANRAAKLLDRLPKLPRVISDEGGIVIARI